jgi:hypothetical protein
VGLLEGFFVGTSDVGWREGSSVVGYLLGPNEGMSVVGEVDGLSVDGLRVGESVGSSWVGADVGMEDGDCEGFFDGDEIVGLKEGSRVGIVSSMQLTGTAEYVSATNPKVYSQFRSPTG